MLNKSKILSIYTAAILTGILIVLSLIWLKLPKQYTVKDVMDSRVNVEALPATSVISGHVDVSGSEVDIVGKDNTK